MARNYKREYKNMKKPFNLKEENEKKVASEGLELNETLGINVLFPKDINHIMPCS